MNNYVKGALIAITVVILFGIFTEPKETSSQKFVNDMAKEVKQESKKDSRIYDSFMDGCMEEAGYAYCKCTYNYLEIRVGDAGIVNFGLEALEENISADNADLMIDAINACSSSL